MEQGRSLQDGDRLEKRWFEGGGRYSFEGLVRGLLYWRGTLARTRTALPMYEDSTRPEYSPDSNRNYEV